MKSKTVTLYSCDFCRKKLQRKPAMERHEEFCYMNPVNTPKCSNCEFLKQVEKTIYFDAFDSGEHSRKVKSFQCTKLNKELYPLSVVRRGIVDDYPETFEGAELMPTKCESFEFKNNY